MKLTEENVTLAMEANGGIKTAAAMALKVHRSTLYVFFEKNPEFAKNLQQDIDANVLDLAEGSMLTLLKDKDRRTIHWFLERRGGSRGYANQQRISGPDGGAIPVSVERKLDLSLLTMDEKKAFLAAVRKAES